MASFTESPKLSPRYADALRFATWAHQKQIRKQGEVPYVCHLLAVSSLVIEEGGNEDEAIAALLHDYIEDINPDGFYVLAKEFSATVAEMVGNLSADSNTEYVERLQKAVNLKHRESVLFISCADKMHNLRSYATTGRHLWKSQHAEFYAQLIQIYSQCDRIPRHWLKEMREKYQFMNWAIAYANRRLFN